MAEAQTQQVDLRGVFDARTGLKTWNTNNYRLETLSQIMVLEGRAPAKFPRVPQIGKTSI